MPPEQKDGTTSLFCVITNLSMLKMNKLGFCYYLNSSPIFLNIDTVMVAELNKKVYLCHRVRSVDVLPYTMQLFMLERTKLQNT